MSPLEQERLEFIILLFNKLFLTTHSTQLIGGAQEPLYIPSSAKNKPHQLFFRENFLSSALHEIAHWCIAGASRRLQQDFGYWYQPDGRTVDQQQQFESVEIKPQALEWIFSNACCQKFIPSADNLNASPTQQMDDKGFKIALINQATQWCETNQLPPRGKLFIEALSKKFKVRDPYDLKYYQISYLG